MVTHFPVGLSKATTGLERFQEPLQSPALVSSSPKATPSLPFTDGVSSENTLLVSLPLPRETEATAIRAEAQCIGFRSFGSAPSRSQ